jgi:muramidase (phage lysozyme)
VTRDDLLGLLSHDNLQAFLHVIREGESSNDDSGYTVLNGGEHFQAPPWEHPNRVGQGGKSTAAGAYQTIAKTWAALVTQYGFVDFSPINQDCGAAALIVQHGALDLVLAGRPLEAIRRINSKWIEWECFERKDFLAQVPQIFAAYGGKETGRSVPVAPVTSAAQTKVEKPMGIFAALLPTILQSLPQLISVFGSSSDSEVAKRNQAAGVLVADTLVKATQAVNLQDAVERLNDPQNLAAAHDAINALIPSLVESGGGGIGEARKAAFAPDQTPFWKNPAFIIAALLAPLIYMVAVEILFNPSGQTWSDDIKMMFVTAIVSGLLGSITGFFLGSSLGSQSKNAVAKA